MKIALHITVEVDAGAWAAEWGTEEVREDVKSYVADLLHGSNAASNGDLKFTFHA